MGEGAWELLRWPGARWRLKGTHLCARRGRVRATKIESRGRGRSSQAGEALLPSLPVCPQRDLRGPFPAPTESEDPWGVNARACSQGPRPRHTWVPMSPEARASGFLLCWSQHLRGHVSTQLSRWVAVSSWPVQKDIQCHLTPLLCPKAYIALPEFFSLILSLSGDRGPHLGGSPPVLHACLWLRTAHTGLRHPARCRPQRGLPSKWPRIGGGEPRGQDPALETPVVRLESRPSPNTHQRPPYTIRRSTCCRHDRHTGHPASTGLSPGPFST